jgi:hypothetical protein
MTMASDYKAISAYNEEQLGKDRSSRKSQVAMYTDPVHFIYELIQNADDAGATKISFQLIEKALVIEHNGEPFTESNVKAISYFEKSDKTDSGEEITKIGHFGLGFKSVFAYTASPRIYSGQESFKITQLYTVEGIACLADLKGNITRFILPFDHLDEKPVFIEKRKLKSPEDAYKDIAEKLSHLGADTILFTKSLQEICWTSPRSGRNYRRESLIISEVAKEVKIHTDNSLQGCYLIFDQPIFWRDENGYEKQHRPVQIAYKLSNPRNEDGIIEKITNAHLSVFFPTTKETHIGFIIQGAYRTNPSRENIFPDDEFNQHLVKQTADLLIQSLHKLKDMDLLSLDSLSVLPLDYEIFKDGILKPLYLQVCNALKTSQLLPKHQGGYSSADESLLARGAKLADIFQEEQLKTLFGNKKQKWLDTSLTINNYPDLHSFLKKIDDDIEVGADDLASKLTPDFFSAQSVDWLVKFIEYIRKDAAAVIKRTPFIRLESGQHVGLPESPNATPTAWFVPAQTEGLDLSAFPLVHADLVANETVREFLEKEEVREIDAADLVIKSILPKYSEEIEFNCSDYLKDLKQISHAYSGNDETKQKLEKQLDSIEWLACVHAGNDAANKILWKQPRERDLFARPDELEISFSELEGGKIYLLHSLFDQYFNDNSSFKNYLTEKCVHKLDSKAIVEQIILQKYKNGNRVFNKSEYHKDLQWITKAPNVASLKQTPWLACVHVSGNTPDEIIWKRPNASESDKPYPYYYPNQEFENWLRDSTIYQRNQDHEAWFSGLENIDAYFLHPSIESIYDNEQLKRLANPIQTLTKNLEVSDSKTVTLANQHSNNKRGLNGFNPNAKIIGLYEAFDNWHNDRFKILWNILLKSPRIISGETQYARNAQKLDAAEKKIEYTEVGKFLIEKNCIPDKQGNWHKPNELFLHDLPDEFDTRSVYAKDVAEKLGMKKPEVEKAAEELSKGDPRKKALFEWLADASDDDLEKFEKLKPQIIPPQTAPSFKDGLSKLTRPQRGAISSSGIRQPNFPITNPERYQNKVNQEAEENIHQYETTRQTIQFSVVRDMPSNQAARAFLYQEYRGRCQITDNTFPKASANSNSEAEYYFEVCSILSYNNANYLNDAGNMLCVSADTAAKLKNASREFLEDWSQLIQSFKNRQVSESQSVKAKIRLAGEICEITWSERHFAKLVALYSVDNLKGESA